MAWDAIRSRSDPSAIATALTNWEASTVPTSIEAWDVEKTSTDYVVITIQYTP